MSHRFIRLTALCLAMLPLFARTAAADQLPAGTNVFEFGSSPADPLVWDISGSYSDNFFGDALAGAGLDSPNTTSSLTFNQDANGNFTGTGDLHFDGNIVTFDEFGNEVDIPVVLNLHFDISGLVRFAAGITRVKFNMKISGDIKVDTAAATPFSGKLSVNCDIDTVQGIMTGVGSVSFTGGGVSETEDFVIPEINIADVMTGDWSVTVVIDDPGHTKSAAGKLISGNQNLPASGQVQLSNGNVYTNVVAQVLYNAAKNLTQVLLKGNTTATKGIKVQIPNAKAALQQDRVLGKLFGQKVRTK